MDLNSYAELAVRLVNTAGAGGEDGDRLANLDGLRALVADREHLNTGVTRNDLDSLRGLRSDFHAFFVACAEGDGEDAAARLNALLIQHPVHPQLSGHDGQPCPGTVAALLGRKDVPDSAKRKMLLDNSLSFYQMDKSKLGRRGMPVARPEPEEARRATVPGTVSAR